MMDLLFIIDSSQKISLDAVVGGSCRRVLPSQADLVSRQAQKTTSRRGKAQKRTKRWESPWATARKLNSTRMSFPLE